MKLLELEKEITSTKDKLERLTKIKTDLVALCGNGNIRTAEVIRPKRRSRRPKKRGPYLFLLPQGQYEGMETHGALVKYFQNYGNAASTITDIASEVFGIPLTSRRKMKTARRSTYNTLKVGSGNIFGQINKREWKLITNE